MSHDVGFENYEKTTIVAPLRLELKYSLFNKSVKIFYTFL